MSKRITFRMQITSRPQRHHVQNEGIGKVKGQLIGEGNRGEKGVQST